MELYLHYATRLYGVYSDVIVTYLEVEGRAAVKTYKGSGGAVPVSLNIGTR